MNEKTKGKILIVEDEFILYDELATYFSNEGYEVLRHNEDEAVDNYDTAIALLPGNPDVAILDININGPKSGLHIGKYIKQNHPSIPVIFLSQDYSEQQIGLAQLFDPADFVAKPKPFDPAQLKVAVYRAILRRNEHAEAVSTLQRAEPVFLNVTEVALHKLTPVKGAPKQDNEDEKDVAGGILTRVNWDDITFIETYGKNTLLLHSRHQDKGYMMRKPLSSLAKELPRQFLYIHQSYIINQSFITQKKSSGKTVFIGDKSFSVKEPAAILAIREMKHLSAMPEDGTAE